MYNLCAYVCAYMRAYMRAYIHAYVCHVRCEVAFTAANSLKHFNFLPITPLPSPPQFWAYFCQWTSFLPLLCPSFSLCSVLAMVQPRRSPPHTCSACSNNFTSSWKDSGESGEIWSGRLESSRLYVLRERGMEGESRMGTRDNGIERLRELGNLEKVIWVVIATDVILESITAIRSAIQNTYIQTCSATCYSFSRHDWPTWCKRICL